MATTTVSNMGRQPLDITAKDKEGKVRSVVVPGMSGRTPGTAEVDDELLAVAMKHPVMSHWFKDGLLKKGKVKAGTDDEDGGDGKNEGGTAGSDSAGAARSRSTR